MSQSVSVVPAALGAMLLGSFLSLGGCDSKKPTQPQGGAGGSAATTESSDTEPTIVTVTGSDTMVNLAQAWADAYMQTDPSVSLEVKGGGSGVGIAALINGTVTIATSSRKLEPKELEECKAKNGKDAVEYMVGYDALAIYVNKDNPLEKISLKQLAEIYGEHPTIKTWEDLGVHTDKVQGEIFVVSRQNSSGTYHYFKEAVLGKKREFRQGMLSQPGSSDLVTFVTKTPAAIGYSGMGYKTDNVRFVPVSTDADGRAVEPSIEATLDKSYPISRPLFLYTLGEASGGAKKFIDWVLSDAGQDVVKEQGYVPLPK